MFIRFFVESRQYVINSSDISLVEVFEKDQEIKVHTKSQHPYTYHVLKGEDGHRFLETLLSDQNEHSDL